MSDAAELHDLSDDSDYAASQQQGFGSVFADDSVPDGVAEVVYFKDNVAIHPTQYSSERIGGRLMLVKRGTALFVSWIPYKPTSSAGESSVHNMNSSLLEKDRNLYTIRDVSLADVHSIRRHTPAIGWQYVIVVLSSGLAFPPLYFYNGGVREFVATIKKHVYIVRSADDSNCFLVTNFLDPLQKSLSSLELHGVVPVANGTPSHIPFSALSSIQEPIDTTLAKQDGRSSTSEFSRKPRPKVNDPARDISIQVLEKFSLVTKFARETSSQLFGENHNNSYGNYEKRQQIVATPAPSAPPIDTKEDTEKFLVDPDPLEAEQLSLTLGKQRKNPLSSEEWSTFFDNEGRVVDSKALRERIFYGGLQHGIRKEAWKLLLGYHEYDTTYAEREYLSSVKKLEYETIKLQWQSITTSQAKRFAKFRERKGLIEKDVVRTDRSMLFYDGDENKNIGFLRDVLLTYSFYNFDLGYCQGMSDFLSPILYVIEDESESFWCFAELMERLGPNFNRDQNGMHSQLFSLSKLVELLDLPLHNYLKQADCLNYFFCFRWVLIQFKREFEYDQIMRLWEVLWTHYFSEHFHLYICVAILKKYRKKIMGEKMDFDTLLKFINELSGQIDLDEIIRDAEVLCIYAGEKGAACIPPGTPPSLPIETPLLYAQQDEDDFGKTGCI